MLAVVAGPGIVASGLQGRLLDLWREELLLLRLRLKLLLCLLLLQIGVKSGRLRLEGLLRHLLRLLLLLLLAKWIKGGLLLAKAVGIAVRVPGRLRLESRVCVVHIACGLGLHLVLLDWVREEIDCAPLLIALVEPSELRLGRLCRFVIE